MAKFYSPSTKSLDPWDVDDNRAWTIIGGSLGADEKELVPTVSDCIEEIAKALADLPFAVYDAKGNLVDDSDDYKNVTGAIPDPYSFLWLAGASLVMSGTAYWRKGKNVAGYTKALTYIAFPNIRPQIEPTTTIDNLKFRREGEAQLIPAKDVIYMWLPDARVEFGPPVNYPLLRAMRAAGALSAISTFIDNYMNSGMVKAFIAQSENQLNPDDKKEAEDYFTRVLMGVKNTLKRIRIIKKGMTIQPIGGGLDELKNVAIVIGLTPLLIIHQ
jgi:phage portal protein BeeE